MKSLIITVLSVALLAAAFFTRPGRDDFKRYIVQEQTKTDTNPLQKVIDEGLARDMADKCTLKDRFLWVEVQQEGKTVYTGAFAHWFSRGAMKSQLQNLEHKSKDGLDKVQQKITKV